MVLRLEMRGGRTMHSMLNGASSSLEYLSSSFSLMDDSFCSAEKKERERMILASLDQGQGMKNQKFLAVKEKVRTWRAFSFSLRWCRIFNSVYVCIISSFLFDWLDKWCIYIASLNQEGLKNKKFSGKKKGFFSFSSHWSWIFALFLRSPLNGGTSLLPSLGQGEI